MDPVMKFPPLPLWAAASVSVNTQRIKMKTKNRSQFDDGAQADAEFVKYWEMEDLVDPGVQPSRLLRALW